MARVTKINVGGRNYDIAHEGVLKNSGFEVVTALPTTGNFNGRQVFYGGIVYTYRQSRWNPSYNPVKIPYGFGIRDTTENLSSYGGYVLNNGGLLSQVPALLDKSLFISNNDNCVKKSEILYELIDNETGTITVQSGIVHPMIGQTLRYTAINPSYGPTELYRRLSQNKVLGKPYSVSITQNSRDNKAIYKIEYYTYVNTTGDGDISNQDNYVWVTVFEKELPQVPLLLYPVQALVYLPGATNYIYIQNVRVSITPTVQNGTSGILINSIDVKYYGPDQQPLIYANRLINYNAAIEPTQTGETFKSIPWILQYLTQGVNWLKANNVRLSAYNTKVAALEQADSDNNASVQSVRTDLTELSNGLAAVARSGSYNDLTDKPTLFSGSYDDLKNTPTIPSSLADLSGSISEGQIPDGSIANGKLANPSMTLNDTTVNLGDTVILPWYVDYNETDYPARIREHWLQIYRNGVWANLVYLGDILPTQVGQITSLDNLDWYNEQVSEYEVDSNTTISILNGTTLPATVLMNCLAEQLTLNLYPINGKQYGKGSLDSLISDLQGKGFSVFVENDLDAIIGSGSDYLVRLKISKVPTAKAIIECYVAR